jgi:hypothetical protein
VSGAPTFRVMAQYHEADTINYVGNTMSFYLRLIFSGEPPENVVGTRSAEIWNVMSCRMSAVLEVPNFGTVNQILTKQPIHKRHIKWRLGLPRDAKGHLIHLKNNLHHQTVV